MLHESDFNRELLTFKKVSLEDGTDFLRMLGFYLLMSHESILKAETLESLFLLNHCIGKPLIQLNFYLNYCSLHIDYLNQLLNPKSIMLCELTISHLQDFFFWRNDALRKIEEELDLDDPYFHTKRKEIQTKILNFDKGKVIEKIEKIQKKLAEEATSVSDFNCSVRDIGLNMLLLPNIKIEQSRRRFMLDRSEAGKSEKLITRGDCCICLRENIEFYACDKVYFKDSNEQFPHRFCRECLMKCDNRQPHFCLLCNDATLSQKGIGLIAGNVKCKRCLKNTFC